MVRSVRVGASGPGGDTIFTLFDDLRELFGWWVAGALTLSAFLASHATLLEEVAGEKEAHNDAKNEASQENRDGTHLRVRTAKRRNQLCLDFFLRVHQGLDVILEIVCLTCHLRLLEHHLFDGFRNVFVLLSLPLE